MPEWVEQMKQQINTLDRLKAFIHVSDSEAKAIETLETRWGTTPYFAALMDPDDPDCPIRRQVVPTMQEAQNRYGIRDYLIWKENRANGETRPDIVARQYHDRIGFTVTDVCANYCRHCFRKEVVVDRELKLRLDVDEGLAWIRDHQEIRDVLITGGDPFVLSDEKIEYMIRKLREIPHIEMIRFGTRMPIVCPQRITAGLKRILSQYHTVPIWVNIQCNHPKEITEAAAKAVFDLLSCGISVGNQAVLLKGINDDVTTFRKLHQRLLAIRVRPYYLFYCEPAPGTDHFRTPIEKGSTLIRDALQGHTSGLAQPLYVVATNTGKIPLLQNDHIIGKKENIYTLRNYQGRTLKWPDVPE